MSNQYLWDRITGRDLSIRAADADRERAAERLRQSHAEGRLDMTEFQQRLERCYEAKTFGQLSELLSDLPRHEERNEHPLGRLRHLRWRLVALAAVVIGLAVLSPVTGHEHHSWLWIPLLFIFWRMSSWRRRRGWAGPRREPGDWI